MTNATYTNPRHVATYVIGDPLLVAADYLAEPFDPQGLPRGGAAGAWRRLRPAVACSGS
jgi:hypothetical protein